MNTKAVQHVPGIQAAIMPIGKNGPDRIITDRLDTNNVHIPLAHLQCFLADAMTTRLGRRRENAEKLKTQLIPITVLLSQLENPRFLVELNFRWNGNI